MSERYTHPSLRKKNWVVFFILLAVIALFYAVTVMKMSSLTATGV